MFGIALYILLNIRKKVNAPHCSVNSFIRCENKITGWLYILQDFGKNSIEVIKRERQSKPVI